MSGREENPKLDGGGDVHPSIRITRKRHSQMTNKDVEKPNVNKGRRRRSDKRKEILVNEEEEKCSKKERTTNENSGKRQDAQTLDEKEKDNEGTVLELGNKEKNKEKGALCDTGGQGLLITDDVTEGNGNTHHVTPNGLNSNSNSKNSNINSSGSGSSGSSGSGSSSDSASEDNDKEDLLKHESDQVMMNTSLNDVKEKKLFAMPTEFSRAQEVATRNTALGMTSVSELNSGSSAAEAELRRCQDRIRVLEERESGNSRKIIDPKVKQSLDPAQEVALGAFWASRVLQMVKYANLKTLQFDSANGILRKAYGELGLDTEGQRHSHRDAIQAYIKGRVGRMRDYFITKVRDAVMQIRKKPYSFRYLC
jgi:hypothetical protein